MGKLLYNAILQVYRAGLYLSYPFNKKARLFIKGRKNIFDKLESDFTKNTSKIAWFHCASLGEFEQGRPVMEAFKNIFPDHKILLTFFSPSGYEVRKHYAGADYIYYLPWDTEENAKKWMEIVNPSAVFFIKYEFWHHYTLQISGQKIPLISFSAIFRPGQIYFKPYGGFNRQILSRFTRIFVQDKASKNLLQNIGISQADIAGDSRFDRVWEIAQAHQSIPLVEKFKQGENLMVIGSSWSEDEAVLIPLMNRQKNMKFIFAPHEINEASIASLQKKLSRKSGRYSEMKTETIGALEVLIIDNVGMLSTLYKYGEYAYIGGAFGKGLHNILEAATFGMPVFWGNKNYKKFKEARDLVRLHGAFAIEDTAHMEGLLINFATNEDLRLESSRISRKYVQENTGATEKIMAYCLEIIK